MAVRRAIGAIALFATLFAIATRAATAAPVPVVFMHGISATSASMNDAAAMVAAALPGVFTYEVTILSNHDIDSEFVSMTRQVELMADELAGVPELAGGFNLFCVSQGGQNCRGYIERFAGMGKYPPVNVFIAWVSVQGGIFGIPDLGHLNPLIPKLLNTIPYAPEVQATLAPAGYWKDPFELPAYLNGSLFLADINNEKPVKNATYRANLQQLAHLVFLYSTVDTVLVPKETGWFSFYAPGSDTEIVPLNATQLYTDDWIGLRAMDEAAKLTFGTTTCEHQDYSSQCFATYLQQWVLPLFQLPWGTRAPDSFPRHPHVPRQPGQGE